MTADAHYFRCSSCGQLNRVPPAALQREPVCGSCGAALDGSPSAVDDAELSRLVEKSPVPVLVDFYADWCGPCRQLAPLLEELGREKRGRLLVVKVDTGRHQAWAERLGIQGIPALFLFDGGALVKQISGYRPLSFWRTWVEV